TRATRTSHSLRSQSPSSHWQPSPSPIAPPSAREWQRSSALSYLGPLRCSSSSTRGSPTGRRSCSPACLDYSRLRSFGRTPREAKDPERDGKRRSSGVVEHEPEQGEHQGDTEGDGVRPPELHAGRDYRGPAEAVLNEHQDHREPHLAGEAHLAGLAGEPDRRVLDDAVTQEQRQGERGDAKPDEDRSGARRRQEQRPEYGFCVRLGTHGRNFSEREKGQKPSIKFNVSR